ncbi:hypothetical protein BT96DRAFT_1016915 [Gymnopus androsaceus JB14]|uniref:C2H2-type domain-containing protein n=1 Tax=Gymnopus androsaceus JB14 TaxID=1447944 RepID=A0A6A4HZ64_9AGAR|nr:hypothetical protein BT96DRAFT_1016915 [Gymnopus androsaceus JB14]
MAPKIPCSFPGCIRTFKKNGDLTKHVNRVHHAVSSIPVQAPNFPQPIDGSAFVFEQVPPAFPFPSPSPPPPPRLPQEEKKFHPYLTGKPSIDICFKGNYLPPNTPPPPRSTGSPWSPFKGEAQFRLADLLFRKVEMSQGNIDELLDIWSLYERQLTQATGCDNCSSDGPFDNHKDLYSLIDNIVQGGATWKCFQSVVDESLPVNAPEWQKISYQVWYRDPDTIIANILANPEFRNDFDVAPYVHLDSAGKRNWADFMSGNFAWRHATQIYEDEGAATVQGAMLVPVILGADKTTVSVATGHVEYHPLYLSIGNVTNASRRAHRNAVIPIGFLAIPKSDRKYDKDPNFRVFKKKLYHASIAAILQTLKPGMKTPVIRKCPDGHFRRVIYDLAAFIADYPEQVYVSGVVQGWCCRCNAMFSDLDGAADRRTRELDKILREEYGGEGRTLWDNFGVDEHVTPFTEGFPRADIHEMLSFDLLHQIIKGCFKDMLVDWSWEYLLLEHGEKRANEIFDDIDRRLAAVPAFPGLRRFPHGRRFKQWTGNDSKALMKIFLPAVAEYLPEEMMKCLSSFMDFCYLVRRSDINEDTLKAIESSLQAFHHYREIFRASGVREHFSIPRMHSMVHYPLCITDFGSPNGLCSSITESRHITAVKKPWRRSNRYNALSQILLTNQRLDKLAALRSMLVDDGFILPLGLPNEDVGPVDSGRAQADVKLAKTRESGYPRFIAELGERVGHPGLEELTRQFLHEQLNLSEDSDLPHITSKINVYHSAIAIFFAPSDRAGIRGMQQERIRCTPSWYGVERRDCVLATVDEDKPGFQGLSAARALLLFSFRHEKKTYPCALIHWFNTYGQRRDPKTGLWQVRPAFHDQAQRNPCLAVVHLDTLVRGVHLVPVYGSRSLPAELKYYQSLDVFKLFYVNNLGFIRDEALSHGLVKPSSSCPSPPFMEILKISTSSPTPLEELETQIVEPLSQIPRGTFNSPSRRVLKREADLESDQARVVKRACSGHDSAKENVGGSLEQAVKLKSSAEAMVELLQAQVKYLESMHTEYKKATDERVVHLTTRRNIYAGQSKKWEEKAKKLEEKVEEDAGKLDNLKERLNEANEALKRSEATVMEQESRLKVQNEYMDNANALCHVTGQMLQNFPSHRLNKSVKASLNKLNDAIQKAPKSGL